MDKFTNHKLVTPHVSMSEVQTSTGSVKGGRVRDLMSHGIALAGLGRKVTSTVRVWG